MTNINLYANNVLSEHPIAAWALDETSGTASSTSGKSFAGQLTATYALEASSYGDISNPGYYIGSGASTLFSSNSGVPMVYGSSSMTNLYSGSGDPSLIVPGFGFLNEDGRYKKYTLEFWIKINSRSLTERRIVGTLGSSDGIYVRGPFIILKVGKNISSYYVGEWGRPMLLALGYFDNYITLNMNGNELIKMSVDFNNIDLQAYSTATDWIGFYAYDDVFPIGLDCISLYAYPVSQISLKSKFLYAQGSTIPDNSFSNYFSAPVIADFNKAQYTKTHNYPRQQGGWKSSISDNLNVDTNVLLSPNYTTPSIIFEESTALSDDWYTYQSKIQSQSTVTYPTSEGLNNNNIIKFQPSYTTTQSNVTTTLPWESEGYLKFDTLSTVNKLDSIYTVVSYSTLPTQKETILYIPDKGGNYFEITATPNVSANNVSISYSFINKAGEETAIAGPSVGLNTMISAGFNISALISSTNSTDFISFLQSITKNPMIIGNRSSFKKQFTGNLHRVGLSNNFNSSKINSYFTNGVIQSNTNVNAIFLHYATYTLVLSSNFSTASLPIYTLDVATGSYWQDYVPMSFLTKKTATGNRTDFIQFNIDYQESENLVSGTSNISTTNQMIKTYVSFDNLKSNSGAINMNMGLSGFDIVPISKYSVIHPNNDWQTKKYEIVNNSIIYIPSDIQDQSLVKVSIGMDIYTDSIKYYPLQLKYIKLSSQNVSESETVAMVVGTRYNKDIYPYEVTVDNASTTTVLYNTVNPYIIYTGSTPYMYLTNYTGFKVLKDGEDRNKGLEIPLNAKKSSYCKINAMQFEVMKDRKFVTGTTEEILRIRSQKFVLKVLAEVIDENSAKIKTELINRTTGTIATYDSSTSPYYAILYKNGTMLDDTNKDGTPDSNLIIKYKEWNMIGLKFYNENMFDIGGQSDGYIRMTGNFVINSVADFKLSPDQEGARKVFQNWDSLLVSPFTNWGVVNDDTWLNREVITASEIPGVDISRQYRQYFGVSENTVETENKTFTVKSDKANILSKTSWSSFVSKPV